MACVPQFIDSEMPALQQFAILKITFLILAAINVALWAVLAWNLRAKFKRPETLQMVNRVVASFLIGAGILTAAVRRST